ncbi:uncharacterized protein [Apostichopus japonicus]|uniref:uncharacterized protein n=1 Tax=Stichopus japonicus TaxID=307972 RepID=UPI003AB3FE67
MHRDELVIVLFTVVIMAEAKVCYRYQRLVNGHFRWAIAPEDETHNCTSYRLGGVSLEQSKSPVGQDTATERDETPFNRITTSSHSSEVARDTSTTYVSPSDVDSSTGLAGCNVFIAEVKNYSIAKNACREIGGNIFGYEHLQPSTSAEATFHDLMSTHELSSCIGVWVDIIRKSENGLNEFEWNGGPDFQQNDSWWNDGQPNNYPAPQDCVTCIPTSNWKLEDKQCTNAYCTLCLDARCG